jgi:hypothetical protein
MRALGSVQRRRTRHRCQHSTVSGCTRNTDQRGRGSSRLSAASSARSAGCSLARGAGGAAPPARGVAPGSRSPWPRPTTSRAGSAQGCGARPARRTTKPQRPPPTRASKQRRIVTCHQAIAAGHGHDRLLAPHGLSSGQPSPRLSRLTGDCIRSHTLVYCADPSDHADIPKDAIGGEHAWRPG